MKNYDLIRISQDKLAKQILDKMYPNSQFDDKKREEKSLQDIKWTLIFISEALKTNNLKILKEYIKWLNKLFEGLNLDPIHTENLIKITAEVIEAEFPEYDIYKFLKDLNNIEEPLQKETNLFQSNVDEYLSFLLDLKRSEAENVIDNLINNGASIQDVYIYVLQAALYEVGNLWHMGKISVGKEHYCTAITQFIMSKMYSKIFESPKNDKKLLACAVGSELHEVGIRMVADIFALNGWETLYLGANLPIEEVIKVGVNFKPDIIALSITMPYHISNLIDAVSKLRDCREFSNTKILIGGLPFRNNKELVAEINADGYAENAREAVEVAERLLS